MAHNNSTAAPPLLPPGIPADTSHLPHDNQQGNLIAACIITWLISAVMVCARFYTRSTITRTMGSSDWFIFASMICSFGVSLACIMEVEFGMGAHIWDLNAQTLSPVGVAESQWISILFYSLSLCTTKISILLLYITLFKTTWIRPAGYLALSLVVLTNLWTVYVIFTACVPLQAFWDMTIHGATCHPQSFWLANNYMHIITDILIFILPIPVVWSLRVRTRQRILLLGVFALGFFVVLISVTRITFLTPIINYTGPDVTYNPNPLFIWTLVEVNAAVWCACAMTLKPLLNRLWPRLLSRNGPGDDSTDARRPMAAVPATIGSAPSRPPISHTRIDSWTHEDLDPEFDEKPLDDEVERPAHTHSQGS